LNLRERGTRAFSTIYCLFPKYFNFPRVDHIAWIYDAASVSLRFKYPHYDTEYKIDIGSTEEYDREVRRIIRRHKLRMMLIKRGKKAAVVQENITFSVLPDGGECKSNDPQKGAVGVVRYHLPPSDKTLNVTK